ncbi:sugar ABC transporter permease [Fictibacillus sp. WQ 8-8]|uniref:carbohydrate ABC transporter permease n=1 Tax=unclassified Fictibacillus TaxID=2644029 RepID=UPI0008F04986|nr:MULTISPECIES: sugar ABC transporter permease [unclassified Fictibacillus]MCQ6266929.1 sugar ABC transporter permease [Fictibacillus sp. WQ 8-8]MED2973962.1 sugar ABC transporter permease [Fictibacillus sp. B-59209]SFE17863.1 carbohydrate ABC transporter membrane protein 1, CUT1 family [Bacillus sp. OV194]
MEPATQKTNVDRPLPTVSPKQRKRKNLFASYGFVGPAMILLFVFLILPAILALYYSFTNYYLLTPEKMKFVGMENYKRLAEDDIFLKSLGNTALFVVIVVPVQTLVALALALLVNQKVRGIKFFRMAFFAPVVTSMVIVSILWTFIYNPDNGLANSILNIVGLGPFQFLTDKDQAMYSIIFMSIWQGAGYQMMIFLAGLQEIPDHLYEAASIDGANAWQKLINITIPGIRNILVFIAIVTMIAATKLFIQPFVMTQGGPLDSTKTLVYMVYETGFKFRDVGYSSAIAILFFVIVLVISILQRKFIKESTE